MTKKEWEQVRANEKRRVRLMEARAKAVSYGYKTTTSFSKAPGGGGMINKIPASVERVAEIDAELAELKQLRPALEREIGVAIQQVENPDYRRVMRYYYLDCLTGAQAAQLAGYSLRWFRRIIKSITKEATISH